jgi:hypothetical protein
MAFAKNKLPFFILLVSKFDDFVCTSCNFCLHFFSILGSVTDKQTYRCKQIEEFGSNITFLSCIPEVPGSSLGLDIEYPK